MIFWLSLTIHYYYFHDLWCIHYYYFHDLWCKLGRCFVQSYWDFFWCKYGPSIIITQKIDMIFNDILIIPYNSLLLFCTHRSWSRLIVKGHYNTIKWHVHWWYFDYPFQKCHNSWFPFRTPLSSLIWIFSLIFKGHYVYFCVIIPRGIRHLI